MTAVIENSSSLATQCLEFCQALERQGKDFKLSISIGSTFTFSLDSRVGKATLPRKDKQRKSPSTLKRNAKRKEEFLAKKSASSSVVTGLESYQKPKKQNGDFQCDQCDANFKTTNGLKIHKGKSHKEVSPKETLRESSSQPSLSLSPLKDQSRMEFCHNCEKEMSPTHLCQDDLDDDQNQEKDDVKACECGCGFDFDPCPAPHHKHLGCAKSCKSCSNVQMQLQMVNLLKNLKDVVT